MSKHVQFNDSLNQIHVIPCNKPKRIAINKASMYRSTRSLGRSENVIVDNWAVYYNIKNDSCSD